MSAKPEKIVELLGILVDKKINGSDSSMKKVSVWSGTHPLLEIICREYKPEAKLLIVIVLWEVEKEDTTWLVKKSITSTEIGKLRFWP